MNQPPPRPAERHQGLGGSTLAPEEERPEDSTPDTEENRIQKAVKKVQGFSIRKLLQLAKRSSDQARQASADHRVVDQENRAKNRDRATRVR